MSDKIFKLKTLWEEIKSLPFLFLRWKEFVWDRDLDSLVCCRGYHCGCMATTVREEIERHYYPKKHGIINGVDWDKFNELNEPKF